MTKSSHGDNKTVTTKGMKSKIPTYTQNTILYTPTHKHEK
jgi:hypothetical protein